MVPKLHDVRLTSALALCLCAVVRLGDWAVRHATHLLLAQHDCSGDERQAVYASRQHGATLLLTRCARSACVCSGVLGEGGMGVSVGKWICRNVGVVAGEVSGQQDIAGHSRVQQA